jgi:hypothetical protein
VQLTVVVVVAGERADALEIEGITPDDTTNKRRKGISAARTTDLPFFIARLHAKTSVGYLSLKRAGSSRSAVPKTDSVEEFPPLPDEDLSERRPPLRGGAGGKI